MTIRNFLFVMCDQLRSDHLGCYGHPHLDTRNIDALAERGLRFERAFVSSGVCGRAPVAWRDCVASELDCSYRATRKALGRRRGK